MTGKLLTAALLGSALVTMGCEGPQGAKGDPGTTAGDAGAGPQGEKGEQGEQGGPWRQESCCRGFRWK